MCFTNSTKHLVDPFTQEIYENCAKGLLACQETICPSERVSISYNHVVESIRSNLNHEDALWTFLAFLTGIGTGLIHKILADGPFYSLGYLKT
jgi:hypothetical protein